MLSVMQLTPLVATQPAVAAFPVTSKYNQLLSGLPGSISLNWPPLVDGLFTKAVTTSEDFTHSPPPRVRFAFGPLGPWQPVHLFVSLSKMGRIVSTNAPDCFGAGVHVVVPRSGFTISANLSICRHWASTAS